MQRKHIPIWMLIGQRGIFLVPSLLQEFVGICWNLAPQACFNISNFQHLQSPAEVCGKDTCRMQQQPLSKASSTSNIFFHREVFTQRIFTHGSFHTEMFLHREVFTQRSFHTVFTQRSLYKGALLHEVESWNRQQFFRKNRSQELSRTSLPHLLQEKTADLNMFKKT